MFSNASKNRSSITLYNHQEKVEIDLSRLSLLAPEALRVCREAPLQLGKDVLTNLKAIEVIFLDDAAITKIHGQFLNDFTSTDVITFEHGEIFISVETAQENAQSQSFPIEKEVLLYLIHGLLHLKGYDDKGEDKVVMEERQETILEEIWSQHST